MCPEESQNLSNPQRIKLTISFFTVIIRKISGTSSAVAIRTCHVAILEQSQITPRMLRIPTVKTENLIDRIQNASVCPSSFVIAGEYVTRSHVFLVQRWPFSTFPLTFCVRHDWAGFFSQESLWLLLTSCFKWEDLFILSWTISFLLEWMKSWIRRDSWIIFSAWLFPAIRLYMDRWFEYYSLCVKRPNIFTWLSFPKMYKGPSRTGGDH